MHILYILIGYILGHHHCLLNNCRSQNLEVEEKENEDLNKENNENKDNKDNKNNLTNISRASFDTYLNISSNKPINPNDLKLNIKTDTDISEEAASKQNQILPVLWAYFMACEQGLLDCEYKEPWEKYDENDMTSEKYNGYLYKRWLCFLNGIIENDNIAEEIKTKEKLKKKALETFKKIDS